METRQWGHSAVLLSFKIIHTATQIWRFLTDFHDRTTIKLHENPSTGSCIDTCGQTDMTN